MGIKSLSILGAGSWGTALAQAWSNKVENVFLWDINRDTVDSINHKGENSRYLPNIKLNSNISADTDLQSVVDKGDLLVVAIPTQYIRDVLTKIKGSIDKPVISASKGIEIDTLKLPTQIIQDSVSIQEGLVFALSGPSFAKEVALGLPTAITLAGDTTIGGEIQNSLNTENFRMYLNRDIIGVQIGGAVKNVIAVATGVSDGLSLGNNARAGLITRGLFEMRKVASVLGGEPETLYGLSGMGDLVLTATGDLSRNRRFGYLLGQGFSVEEALKKVGQVVEGFKTVKAVKKIMDRFSLDLPISDMVYQVIYNNLPVKEAVRMLLSRQPKMEG
ncbi:MAG: NAD(P)-dependent glycerol-3-phosphate dehydrogenase [Aquificae bacterium]|nr:NAD(P)-dependent glycerol-3-phosphate dehydrogenase [Aquificota bacterium]